MKVLFVSANTEKINMPALPLGLACVARAARESGHEVIIRDLMASADAGGLLEEAVRDFGPDVIGISVRNIDDQLMQGGRFLLEAVKETVALCKALSAAPVVLGGAGYSIFPGDALLYLGADMGIEGEGEAALPALLQCIQEGVDPSTVPGLHLPGRGAPARSLIKKMDNFPLPGKSTWSPPRHRDAWMPVQSRRGCPLGCSYCSTPAIEGKTLRKRSALAVADWMSQWADEGFRNFFFVDNTFNLPPSYAVELCRALISRVPGISWRCIVYPHRVEEGLVRLMAGAGCAQVSLGFESGSESILLGMNKKYSPPDVTRTVRMLRDHGIDVMGFLLLGGPGENRRTVEESLAFADSLALQAVKVTMGVRIYPGTPLAGAAASMGVIPPGDSLLFPRYFIAEGLEDWLRETVGFFMKKRPNWTM